MAKRRLSKKKISCWLLLFALIFYFSCGGEKSSSNAIVSSTDTLEVKPLIPIDTALVESIDRMVMAQDSLRVLGLCVYDITAERELYAYHADDLMSPASNMKMLTCVTSLHELGTEYKLTNAAFVSGDVSDGTLNGDLAFEFTHDMNFTSADIDSLVMAVKEKGLRKVNGRVVLDMPEREYMQHEEHWTPGDLPKRHVNVLFRGNSAVRQELVYSLKRHDIEYADSMFVETTVPDAATIYVDHSGSLRYEVCRALLNSSNANAEAMLYPLVEGKASAGSERTEGVKHLLQFVKDELRMDPNRSCRIHDGSGLCPESKLTARLLINLLKYVRLHQEYYDIFMASLPVSGETGTLHDRMLHSEVKGKIHAKTGTLTRNDGISSLSGYCTAFNGHELAFAIMHNRRPVADARIWQDQFCRLLVTKH